MNLQWLWECTDEYDKSLSKHQLWFLDYQKLSSHWDSFSAKISEITTHRLVVVGCKMVFDLSICDRYKSLPLIMQPDIKMELTSTYVLFPSFIVSHGISSVQDVYHQNFPIMHQQQQMMDGHHWQYSIAHSHCQKSQASNRLQSGMSILALAHGSMVSAVTNTWIFPPFVHWIATLCELETSTPCQEKSRPT